MCERCAEVCGVYVCDAVYDYGCVCTCDSLCIRVCVTVCGCKCVHACVRVGQCVSVQKRVLHASLRARGPAFACWAKQTFLEGWEEQRLWTTSFLGAGSHGLSRESVLVTREVE